jgi:hypothetical protein
LLGTNNHPRCIVGPTLLWQKSKLKFHLCFQFFLVQITSCYLEIILTFFKANHFHLNSNPPPISHSRLLVIITALLIFWFCNGNNSFLPIQFTFPSYVLEFGHHLNQNVQFELTLFNEGCWFLCSIFNQGKQFHY